MNRSFWYIWGAQTVSALGDAFGNLSMGWMVYKITGSEMAMGSLWIAYAVPEIVIRLVGAPLIDRLDRKRLMSALDVVRALAFGALVVAGSIGETRLWQLYLVTIINGACAALFYPAGMAVLPSLVPKETFVRANSLLQGSVTAAYLIGPALSGILLAVSNPLPGLAVDALSFALSAGLILLLPQAGSAIPAESTNPRGTGGYIQETLQGIAWYGKMPVLLVLLVIVSIANICSSAITPLMIPYGKSHLGTDALGVGLMESAYSVGSLAGSFVSGLKGEVAQRRLVMLGSLTIWGVFNTALGMIYHLPVALSLRAGSGLMVAVFNVYAMSILVQLIPDRMRGRALSVGLLIAQGAGPVGAFLGGFAAQHFGMPTVFITAGMIAALAAFTSLLLPALRSLDGDLSQLAASAPD